ncbi:MAG: hypothetical protein H0X72_08735 [Acidobacteria bacterium]|jgi:hypothetical protein|nr:hypothetical protein [Acidobacteriota bacterium]
MKKFSKKARLIFVSLIIFLCLLIPIEQIHHYNYGHYFSYGFHIDVKSEYGYIGIPGQTQMYSGQFTNFSILPVKFVACDYVSDTLSDETDYPYGLQKWNSSANSWETIFAIESEEYCQPMLTHGGGNHIVSKWILPIESIQVVSPEATGARDTFRKGDQARFLVFRDVSSGNAWNTAIISETFVIEDDVIKDDYSPSLRIQH